MSVRHNETSGVFFGEGSRVRHPHAGDGTVTKAKHRGKRGEIMPRDVTVEWDDGSHGIAWVKDLTPIREGRPPGEDYGK